MSTVSCPTCKRPVVWNETSPWRPFCSERCKLIDLGAWAAGQRSIPDTHSANESDLLPDSSDDES
jgi:endogenous inhibitor of DNA gyrase (YacG/DUF329 family)